MTAGLQAFEDVEDAYPLTMLQTGMLFHSEYSPESAIYHDIFSLHLQAPLELEALQTAIKQLLARHAVLRTSFDLTNFSKPMQLVHRTVILPFQAEDLRPLSSAEQEDVLSAWIEAEKRRGFDWSLAPLVRFQIHRRTEAAFQFGLSCSHAILDGWSVASLLTELFQRYFSLLAGSAPPDEAPSATLFRDFVALEQEALRSAAAQRYWTQKLSDSISSPLARWSSMHQTSIAPQLHTLAIPISREISAGLKRLALSARVPLKSVLLAAHLRVMSLLSGQRDVLTGLVSNGRPETIDGERVLGLFLNTLPHRQQLTAGSWMDLAQETFEVEREALPFRRYPLAQMQQDRGGQPLFETAFNFIHFHVYQNLRGLRNLQVLGGYSFNQTNFTLLAEFSLDLVSSQVHLNIKYNACEICDEYAMAIGKYYATTLTAMAREPLQRYAYHSLLSPQERQQLLLWNGTQVDYSPDCIHEMFEKQARRQPEAIAVAWEEQQITYGELNRRANQLARYLQSRGVGPETHVGICLDRSPDLVIALLSILKAGGAYVPLDPRYPTERLAFMLHDAHISLLLTQQALREHLADHRVQFIYLDTDWQAIASELTTNPVSSINELNVGYVIYTSGSTGQPKGVAMTHQALSNLLSWQLHSSLLSSGARTLQFTSASFDVSFQEIFSTWCSGGTLVLISEELRRDSVSLLHFLGDNAIDRLFLPFVALQQLAEVALDHGLFPTGLREVMTAGEQLQITRPIARLFEELSVCSFYNQYGPAESHVVTAFTLTGPSRDWPIFPPIGRPIANIQVYLLDAYLQPVPVGVPAEIYLGGIGIARGYLDRPALTAERFIPNPFSKQSGARLYRTGDLACYLPDSQIEFLGRLDHQVKLRGFRIEPGEIEALLVGHPTVRDAVVLVREDAPADRRLVAYIVPEPRQIPSTNDLLRYLKAKLPDYMLPAAFVLLDTLPLTSNGKLDRNALPAPSTQRPELDEVYIAPRTPLEETLVQLWSQVLGLKRIGVRDNFFEIGGHSLLATQVVARVRDVFQMELPLRTLFEMPTVARLAEHIEIARQTRRDAHAVALKRFPRDGDLLLSFAQQRLWFLEQLTPDSLAYHIPLAAHLRGSLNVAALALSLNEITRRHEVLRTTFTTVDGYPVQVIAPVLSIPLPLADLSELPRSLQEVESQRLTTEEARHPFDLTCGPLVRARLLRLSRQDHVLVLIMHHIVSDGWSIDVLTQELASLYAAFCEGKSSPLPELPIQYADFACWQRQWLLEEVLTSQRTYWHQQLQNPPLLDLPTDHPRPLVQTFRGSRARFEVAPGVAAALQQLSQQEGVTLFMTLLAAWAMLLSCYSRQEDLVIGSPIANRRQTEVEALIGCFVNTLVLRINLSGNPSFLELLQRTREVCLEAYANQDLPFEQLVEDLAPTRLLSYSPLFQVMFMLHNAPRQVFELAHLSLEAMEIAIGTTKFDLTLQMVRTEQGLVGSLEYNTDLFEASTIQRMLGHYQTLLTSIVTDPHRRLSALPYLTPAEQQQLLVTWNATQMDYPQDQCLHQLFEAQVERTPEAIAIIFEEHHLSFHDLNRRANQLAHYLHAHGVAPETLVALCLPRSLDLLVAILAILKAGGAYVPLDPSYPSDRLAFLLHHAQVSLLLTQQHLLDRLPAATTHLLLLDTLWPSLTTLPDRNPAFPVSSQHLAYVLYTSGSTGIPKGVAIEHHSSVSFLHWAAALFPPAQRQAVLAATSICFDLSIFELFVPLCWGGQLILASQALDLPSLPAAGRVSLLNTVPTVLRELLRLGGLPQGVRLINLAGEVLPHALVEQVYAQPGVQQVLNLYGPTEATTYATAALIERGEQEEPGIGRPIANTQVYVLDQHLQPVPIGVVGELYLGGAGIARGYLHQPELSAERFVPHPWSQAGGQRLYRTGDLVCYRPDGTLAFVGRADTQVKLRGLRIELGEIETVLANHPTVLDAIVLVRKDIFGDQHLVAYIAPHPQQILSVPGLLEYLKAKLPNYMMPSTIIKLETLPLTPNGKIDRHKLPAFEGLDRTLETAYVAPQTELEQAIASVWQKVLHIEQIGVHDNFFDLGGHSLLLARIHSDLRTLLPNGIVLIDLFKYPTISSLAAYIGQKQPETPSFQRSIKRAETRRVATQRQRQYRQQHRTPS